MLIARYAGALGLAACRRYQNVLLAMRRSRYSTISSTSPITRSSTVLGQVGPEFVPLTAQRRLQYTASDAQFPPPNAQSINPPPSKRPLYERLLIFFAIASTGLLLGAGMAAVPVADTARHLLNPPSDEETLQLFAQDLQGATHAATVDAYIQSHPLVEALRQQYKYIESRPHLKIPPALRPNNLTGGTLLGETKIATPPLTFTTPDGSDFVSIQYLGPSLCGHPGIIHGGLLATLLDEGLARCCFPALPNKVGVTASLKIDYRKPCMAEQYVVLRARTTKVDGRKAWVVGHIETLPAPDAGSYSEDAQWRGEDEKMGPIKLVEADALFVEPKHAATMSRIYSTQSDSAVDLQRKKREAEEKAKKGQAVGGEGANGIS